MQFKSNLTIMSTLVLLLLATQASHARLLCYVCENCPQITTRTPLKECNAEYVNSVAATVGSAGTTLPSMMTTTTTTNMPEMETTPRTTMGTTRTTTTTMMTTPTTTSSTTSMPMVTQTPTPRETTMEDEMHMTTTPSTYRVATWNLSTELPSLPTGGIPETTSTGSSISSSPGTIILPINYDSVRPVTEIVEMEHDGGRIGANGAEEHMMPSFGFNATSNETYEVINATPRPYVPSSEIRVRQRRQAPMNNDVTYYCYKTERNVNGSMIIDRGCARAATIETVCPGVEMMKKDMKINKCSSCSNSRCNGSSALGVSVVALTLAVVAAIMSRK